MPKMAILAESNILPKATKSNLQTIFQMVALVLVVFLTFEIADSHTPLFVEEVGRFMDLTNLSNSALKKEGKLISKD